MQPVQQFAFEKNAVRVVLRDDEPWFVGVDICRALQIRNNRQALSRLDDDEKGVTNGDTLGGDQKLIVCSEPGLYRLIFTSRSPVAERFKRWLAHEVLPEIRRTGAFVGAATPLPLPPTAVQDGDPRTWPVIQKMQCVQLCARIHGRLRAEVMWRQVGLPAVPPPPITAIDEARMCLRQLLDHPVSDGGATIRQLLENALDDDENARAELIGAGLRVYPDREAFLIANGHPRLAQIYAGTDWAFGRYLRVLRRLPGAAGSGTARFGGVNRRGSLIPALYLDEDAPAALLSVA